MLWPIPADSADDTRYTDKRTELWGLMKDWCNAACLPDDDALALTFAYTLAQRDSATSAARKKAPAGSNDRGVTGRRVGRSHKPLKPLVSKYKIRGGRYAI